MTHLIIDGNNLAYRIRYGIGDQINLKSSVIAAFIGQIAFYLTPDIKTVTVVFDAGIPSIRTQLVPEYKEHRKDSDEHPVVHHAMFDLETILPTIRVNVLKVEGFEADDLINALSKRLAGKILIVSSDHDLFQCVTKDNRVMIYSPTKRQKISWQSVLDHYGVAPDRWSDFRALTGDTSDNIPGVRGIGKVYGKQILESFDNVYSLVTYLSSGLTRNDWKEDTGLPKRFFDLLMMENNAIIHYERVSNLEETLTESWRACTEVQFIDNSIIEIEAVGFRLACYELLAESYRFSLLMPIEEGIK